MKKIVFTILLLLIPQISEAAIVHVQTLAGGGNCGAATDCGVTLTNTVTGNLLVDVCRYSSGGRTLTVTDGTNTYALGREHIQTNDSNGTIDVQYSMNITGGASTAVNCHITGASLTMRASASEFSGVATSNAADQVNSAEGSGTTLASGSITPAVDGELLFVGGFNGIASSYTAGTDFTILTSVPTTSSRLTSEYYIQPTAASHDGTITQTNSSTWAAVIVSFKPSVASSNPGKLRVNGSFIINGSLRIPQ